MTTRQAATLKAWQGDWQQRLTDRLRAMGFASAAEYVARHPTASLLTLADDLSGEHDDIAAEQLKRRLLDEAKQRGDIERCARDLLVRRLHQHLPDGWRSDWGPDIPGDTTTLVWRRASALGGWTSSVAVHFPEFDDALQRVRTALRDSALAEGWLPANADDPLLVDLFSKHWPPVDGSRNPS